ncbi:MAG: Helix-turn-helix domain [Bacteroidota bacterium]|jgi:transcriptional regulator with XRE-family HTH domain
MSSEAATHPIKTVAQELGQRIRKARNEKDLTIQALADMVGIEYTQMSRIELGKINTSVLQVCRISIALGICMSTLLKDLELNVSQKQIEDCGPDMLFPHSDNA